MILTLNSPVVQCLAMRIKTFKIFVGIGCLLAVSTTARAQQVAPLVPKFSPAKVDALVIRFHEAMGKGLRMGGLQVISPKTVRSRMNIGVANAGCFERACLSNARSLLGLNRLATSKVEVVGKSYTIEVRLYQGSTLMGSGKGHCDICTVSEAVGTMAKVATELGTRTEEPPTDSPGIRAAPKPKPKAKPKAKPKPKAKAKPVAKRKPKPKRKPVVKPKPRIVKVDDPDQKTGEVTRPWPLWPALVAGGVGLVGLGVGIPLVALDGEGAVCRGPAKDDKTNCSELYNTGTAGWLITGLGLVAHGAGAVLTILHLTVRGSSDEPEKQEAGIQSVVFSPSPSGGFILGASGRF